MAGGFSVEFGTEFVDFLLGEIAVLADDLVEFFFDSRLNGKKRTKVNRYYPKNARNFGGSSSNQNK